jgi:hypothetical protein
MGKRLVGYSRTPLNPYPLGGLLRYWLDELRLKKRLSEVCFKGYSTVLISDQRSPCYRRTASLFPTFSYYLELGDRIASTAFDHLV